MGYKPAPPRLNSKESRQAAALQLRSDLATQLKLAKPNHTWQPHPRNPVFCAKCDPKSPFKMDMRVHMFIVREWP